MTLLVLILTLLCAYFVIKASKIKEVNSILGFSLIFLFILWYVIPILSTINFWIFFEEFLGNKLSFKEYLKYATIDLLYFLFIILFFIKYSKKKTSLTIYNNKFQYNKSFFSAFYYASIVIILTQIFFDNSLNLSYNNFNDLEISKGEFYNVLSFFNSYAVSFQILVILLYKDRISNVKYKFAIIIYLFYIFHLVTIGSRISILGPLIIFLYFYFYKMSHKLKILLTIPVISFGILAAILMPILANMRTESNVSIENLSTVKIDKFGLEPIIAQFAIKTNSVYYGSFLLKYDGIGAAGINPYLNSLYSIIPRFIYPNKPVPTSKDGTSFGIPSRVAANLIISNSTVFNVGVPASLVALWHGGIFAFLFNILFMVA